jgi:hypothetical protein
MRTGLEVGQLYAWTETGWDGSGNPVPRVVRAIRITSVHEGTATGTVIEWRGRPKMRGVTVMLPDDSRYKLSDETVLGPRTKVRRKSALKDA